MLTAEQLQSENEALRNKLAEAAETLRAIQSGEVDALVVATPEGRKIYTLQDADHSYRLFVEEMQEGAVTLSADGTILYCNRRFAALLGYPLEFLISSALERYVALEDLRYIHSILTEKRSHSGRTMNLLNRKGEAIPVHLSANVLELDNHVMYCLVVTDMRQQQQHDEEILFMQNLGLVVSHAKDLVSGFNKILELICTRTGWAMGEIWLPNSHTHTLDRVSSWHNQIPAVIEFAQQGQKFYMPMEAGRTQELWRTQKMVLIQEIGDMQWYARVNAAMAAGLMVGIAVPIWEASNLMAVQVFFLEEMRPEDEHWVRLVSYAASHLGTFIQRKLAEDALQASEERLRTLVENIDQLFWLADASLSEFVYISPAFEAIFGEPTSVLQNKPANLAHYIHPEDRTRFLTNQRRHTAASPEDSEYRMVAVDGSQRYLWARTFPIVGDSGKTPFLAGLISDITQRKHEEQQVMQLQLERERIQILSNFVANASHEFRTPLSVIQSNLYLLGRSLHDQPQLKRIDTMKSQIGGLSALVDNLIKISLLDSDIALKWIATDLSDLVENSIIYERVDKPIKIIKLLEAIPPVLVDPEWLAQAIREIFSNACRFTPEGGQIVVRTYAVDQSVVVEIADSGVGITAQDRSHIFERFYRVDYAHTTPGFGLGLPIAQRIVELHRGTIECESIVTQGTIFRMILPRRIIPFHL